MELMNLLADIGISVYGQTYSVHLNWIGNLIRILITAIGSVGVGIIVFSLILKLITLPFDIIQRVTMRKQNIKMEENRERMEKLQKQYANDQELYNQKVMEMYKENGISMFASCLPMIITLIIFIVAINAFNAYSQYANVQNYNDMVQAYNTEMYKHCADLEEDNVFVDGDYLVVKDVADKNKYIYYTVAKTENSGTTYEEQKTFIQAAKKNYYVDIAKAKANAEIMTEVSAIMAANDKLTEEEAIRDYFVSLGQDAVVRTYHSTVYKNASFLWIKNIWATDASYKHPVLSYTDFEVEAKRENFQVGNAEVTFGNVQNYTDAYKGETYNKITAKLGTQKTEANGYFVLIALSIITILVQQLVTQKSQQAQQQLGTVDGAEGGQQKMTMIIMTVMFAIFSFMYSSAFSIYMITSNVFSLLSTLIINAIVDAVENKKTVKKKSEQSSSAMERIEAAKKKGVESAQATRNNDEK